MTRKVAKRGKHGRRRHATPRRTGLGFAPLLLLGLVTGAAVGLGLAGVGTSNQASHRAASSQPGVEVPPHPIDPVAVDRAPSCKFSMGPPVGWTSAELTNDEHFTSLGNWNYGITDDNTSGSHGSYYTWAETGQAPYLGATIAATGPALDYDLPGNVSQTSSGLNRSLLSTYSPQTFKPDGCGVSFTATYTGDRTYHTDNAGPLTLSWTSGFINSYNKISFPTPGHSAFFVQFLARMGCAGPNRNNGSWSSLWFLGQGNEQRDIDLQETGVAGGESTQLLNSHLQNPGVTINTFDGGVNLCDSYNIYGVSLINGVVTTYIDGIKAGQMTSGTTGPYFAILGQSVFSPSAGFANPPTTNSNMTESVAEMQVYQR